MHTFFSQSWFPATFFKNNFRWRWIFENMKMSSSLSIILETGINVFKSNSQIIENTKYYEISTIYECVEKLSMTIACNICMICLELN